MKTKKSTALEAPSELRNLFVYSVVGAFAVTVLIDIHRAISQVSSNPNLSGFYITFLSLGLLPLAVFLVAYLLHANVKNAQTKVFDSLVFTVSVLALNIALSSILFASLSSLMLPFGDFFGSFGLHLLVAAVLFVVSFAYLVRLRQAKRW